MVRLWCRVAADCVHRRNEPVSLQVTYVFHCETRRRRINAAKTMLLLLLFTRMKAKCIGNSRTRRGKINTLSSLYSWEFLSQFAKESSHESSLMTALFIKMDDGQFCTLSHHMFGLSEISFHRFPEIFFSSKRDNRRALES